VGYLLTFIFAIILFTEAKYLALAVLSYIVQLLVASITSGLLFFLLALYYKVSQW